MKGRRLAEIATLQVARARLVRETRESRRRDPWHCACYIRRGAMHANQDL
jgi:hypothetical protein